jgi:hypothetical protein
MKAAAKDLEPGSSVFDHDHPERARLVHSVTTLTGTDRLKDGDKHVPTVLVSFGHPSGPADGDEDRVGVVPADKQYDVIADASGQRL